MEFFAPAEVLSGLLLGPAKSYLEITSKYRFCFSVVTDLRSIKPGVESAPPPKTPSAKRLGTSFPTRITRSSPGSVLGESVCAFAWRGRSRLAALHEEANPAMVLEDDVLACDKVAPVDWDEAPPSCRSATTIRHQQPESYSLSRTDSAHEHRPDLAGAVRLRARREVAVVDLGNGGRSEGVAPPDIL